MPASSGMVHLRRARSSDARAIADVHVATWRHAYSGLLPDKLLGALSVDARERFWKSELDVTPPDRAPWLADSDGELAGFASVGPSRDADAAPTTGELYTIYVLPEWWDRGVGGELLRHAERDLVDHGYSDATLWVLTTNERARRFYERAGWRLDGERVERMGDIEIEEVRYRRRLQRSPVG